MYMYLRSVYGNLDFMKIILESRYILYEKVILFKLL